MGSVEPEYHRRMSAQYEASALFDDVPAIAKSLLDLICSTSCMDDSNEHYGGPGRVSG